MHDLYRGLRQSVRALLKRPGFTAVAVLTLAIGIGATSAIFSVLRDVVFRPLPYEEPERIVQVWNPWSNEPGVTRGRSSISSLDFAEIREAVGGFQQVAAYTPPASVNLSGTNVPERVLVTQATADLFAVLGSRPLLGRVFADEEDQPGGTDVVVLSHGLWQQRFGGETGVLDRVIELDSVSHRIIGVMPPSFRMPADYLSGDATQVWKPLGLDAQNLDRNNQWLHVIARLRPDATLAVANAQLESLTGSWIEQGFKVSTLPSYYAVSIHDELFGASRPALMVLLGAVVFVLLIACANVANLLLVRADERRAEIALRTALGASRPQIVSQLLTESLVLAMIGGAVGTLFAYAGVKLLIALDPANLPRVEEVQIDLTTLGFTALVSLATATIFGLAPALHAARAELSTALRSSSRSATGSRRGQRFRGALAVTETALAVVLVIGASLMIRTFAELTHIRLGFDPDNMLTFSVSLPASDYAEPEPRVGFHMRLTERLSQLPGVQSAGAARTLPLTGRLGGGSIEVEGAEPPRPGEGLPNTRWQIVTPGYFETMDYERSAGRLLNSGDLAGAVPVVVVNETAEEMLWPGESAIGRRVRNTNSDVPWFTVVGVVRDVRHSGVIDTPNPTLYFALDQIPLTRSFTPTTMMFAVKTSSAPLTLTGAVRETVRSMNPNLPVSQLQTMDDIVDDALAQPRFTMTLLSMFAVVAMALALIGIYGLLSYTVAQQRREIGIRLALGAPRASVLRLVVGKGMRLALFGLGAGLLAALFLTQLLERMLFGVQPLDPLTFIAVPAGFAAVALVASWIPARRATGVDPVIALRQE